MITGTYTIYSNGEKIAEYPNMITSNGLVMINRYLSGQTKYWADTLVVGALSTVATASSTASLQYEVYRYPVNLKAYQTSGSVNQILLKATIDPTAEFKAYEIGILPIQIIPESYYDHFSISGFSEVSGSSSLWRVNGSPVVSSSTSPSPRVGSLQIPLAVTTSSTTNTASIGTLSIDSSKYSGTDFVHLLYYCSASISAASVTVLFGDTAASQNVWSGSTTISSNASGTFYVAVVDMADKPADFTDQINTSSVRFYGSSGSVKLDHMKFVLNDILTEEDTLISRTTSSASPLINKIYSQPMEIEYSIRVT